MEILEDRNRTLTNVQHGSILLTLFCPNPGAQQQLQSEEWIRYLKLCLTQLLNAIGRFSFTVASGGSRILPRTGRQL